MQGRRAPSFLLTKKNPAPAGDDDGRIRPEARHSPMYLSIASRSGADREKSRPLGGLVPERRSMEQSYDRWGGREVALLLLNTSPRSWYSLGTEDKSGGGYVVGLDVVAGMVADRRQLE